MNNGIFGSIPIQNWTKARFDLSHDVKLTGNMGVLIPVLMEECLPGESWKWTGNLLIRFAPLLFPIMHRVKARLHCYHVPNRILTTAWKEAITGGESGESTVRTPYFVMNTYLDSVSGSAGQLLDKVGVGSLWDYVGMPTIDTYISPTPGYTDTNQINALPFLAYQMIWQYYYKDPNVDGETTMQQGVAGGIMAAATFNVYNTLRPCAWEKDAFTSALPWPQRGADVLMPFESIVDKVFDKVTGAENTVAGPLVAATGVVAAEYIMVSAGTVPQVEFRGTNGTFTINDMRTALVTQQWLELSARGGPRYNEFVLQQYNTVVPDFRIDQPEYIGGSTQFVEFSEVLTTANSQDADDNTIPPATMTGHGISVSRGNSFTYTTKEHGWMVVILSIMPETNYQQGLPRKFTRLERMDYAYPVFAGLGEQEVLSKEIYYDPMDPGSNAGNEEVFGYQQRFWEYKHVQNRTCGEFKTTLNGWTMTRIFSVRPSPVSGEFIYSDPTTRIFAVEDASHKLWMQVVHQLSVLRPLPYYSVPGVLKV